MENQSAPMEFLLLEEIQFLEVKGDDALSQWEFVNVVDAEEGEGEGEDDGDNDSVQTGFGSWESSRSRSISSHNGPIECEAIHYRLLLPDVEMKEDLDVDDDGNGRGDHHFDDVDDVNRGCRIDNGDVDLYSKGLFEEEEDDDDDDDYYLDDELVPWSACSKFGRQRMRKLEKRAFSKMHNSKRSPYLFVRPGCVHGKHGLGLKHNY